VGKIKIEIDLLRDTLRNIFVVMFSLASSIVGLSYKIVYHFDNIDPVFLITGLIILIWFARLRMEKIRELDEKLKKLED